MSRIHLWVGPLLPFPWCWFYGATESEVANARFVGFWCARDHSDGAAPDAILSFPLIDFSTALESEHQIKSLFSHFVRTVRRQ